MDVPMRNEIEKMLAAQKAELLAALENSGKAVKSVQMQYISSTKCGSLENVDFTISEVDPTKCAVYAFGLGFGNHGAIFSQFNSNTSVKCAYWFGSSGTNYRSVIVIEYY